jgi:hypothetical protein
LKIFDKFRKKKGLEMGFPPVPAWKPDTQQPIEKIVERLGYYTNNQRDIAVFRNGTCVILNDGLSNSDAHKYAREVLHKIYHYHPDMNPVSMDDGNILVKYNHPGVNVVLESHVKEYWDLIEGNFQRALTTAEVLMTPLGANMFDDFGKKALYGRCFMFMDAQNPEVICLARKKI